MMFAVLFVLVFAVGSGFCANDSFDFSLVVSRWPASYVDPPIPQGVNGFTLHGIWPSRNDTSYPSNCDPSRPFSASQIADLVPMLDIYWPDLDDPGTDDLWTHEWDTHGTCATDGQIASLKTEHDFFQFGITIAQKLDIVGLLVDAKIVPGASYSFTQYMNALTLNGGIKPLLMCNEHGGQTCLCRVYYCIDNTLKLMQCNAAITKSVVSNAKCGTSGIYLPAIVH